MRSLLNHNFFTSSLALFLIFATSGVVITLHHCHRVGGKFSAKQCPMDASEHCTPKDTPVKVSSVAACCESHTFSLRPQDDYTISPQQESISKQTTKNLQSPSLVATSEPAVRSSLYHLLFPSHSPPHTAGEDIFLRNCALLI